MHDGSPGIGHNGGPALDVQIPGKILEAFCDAEGNWIESPIKALYGGRGAGRSWGIARMLLAICNSRYERVLCCREFQVSIADSVHKLLCDQIEDMGLQDRFDITDTSIVNPFTGAEFIFKGIRKNIREIKSLEGITKTWVEEGQAVSKESWQILLPTVMRRPGAEVWISYNPDGEEDPTHTMCVGAKKRADVHAVKATWADNPWFPPELDALRLVDLASGDADAYQWIWEGDTRKISEALIFRRRVEFRPFEEPTDPPVRPFYGADWGFANDPTALIRFYIVEVENPARPGYPWQDMYVTHEAYGWRTEIDDIAEKIFDEVPGSRDWPIKADSARPETISYMGRQGFNIDAAEKWPGSVEDGVEHMRGFRSIIVHPRCEHLSREFRLYSYKVDPQTMDVLPIIVDAWNHGIDAIRYGLDGIIQHRGGMGVWRKLAK